MDDGKLAQQLLAFRRKGDQHLPPILIAMVPQDRAMRFQPVNQFNHAVVAQLQTPGQFADGRLAVFRQAFNGKHQLMLLGFDPGRARLLLAEVQEAPDLKAELGQSAVIGQGKVWIGVHSDVLIISYYDIYCRFMSNRSSLNLFAIS